MSGHLRLSLHVHVLHVLQEFAVGRVEDSQYIHCAQEQTVCMSECFDQQAQQLQVGPTERVS